MQLAVTILGNSSTCFISEVLNVISQCDCRILRFKTECLAQTMASYLLINGNWNQIAKLEVALDSLQSQLNLHIQVLRPNTQLQKQESISYSLDIITAPSHDHIIESISAFLLDQDVSIEEIDAQYRSSSSAQTPLFIVKFILLVPTKLNISALRKDLSEFSDNLNIDAIFNPIK